MLRRLKTGVVHGKSAIEARSQSVLRIERDRADEGGCAISTCAQQVRDERQSGRQPGAELADPVRLGISAGKDGCVGDHRQRGLRIGVLENHALASEAIEVRRESCFRAEETHAIGARGTQGDEDDIRLAGRLRGNRPYGDHNHD